VIGNSAEEFRQLGQGLEDGKCVVDLVRIADRSSDERYDGICW
jgi:GDP-mannose 6-dehydrogenase